MNRIKSIPVVPVLFLCTGAGLAASPDSGGGILEQISLVIDTPQIRSGQQSGSATLRAYEDEAADSTRPDSVRMNAAGKRADAAFALREYETARDYYKKASGFEKKPGRYHFRFALAALANGDTAEARALFVRMSDNGETAWARESQVVLGELALTRKDYQEAMRQFRKSGPFQPLCSWSVPAALGKLVAARGLGMADSAAAYERQISGYANTMLEKERFRQVRAAPAGAAQELPPARAAAAGRSDSSFTLQVGAFGSHERANALRKKLSAAFRDASCVPAVIDERTFYRVWVGDFPSRDEAERFARKKLAPQGYVYRVVEKE